MKSSRNAISPYAIAPNRAAGITDGLLCWYDENKRDLPWRHTRDPYAIWVSEIMAQQTRIGFLLGYYERFMRQFPTLETLANADEADVLKAWEGLGYYSRAKNMQKAARQILAAVGGVFPRTKSELLSLPGIGEYTAGAILSIAFGLPTPAVDGNVLRVFSRLEDSAADIMLPQTRQTASAFVSRLMPGDRAGCFTQALMELGALVCTPKSPECAICPLADLCKAKVHNRQHELPKKTSGKPPKTLAKTILILRNPGGQILMRQRDEKLLSGLWEFYMLEAAMDEAAVLAHLKGINVMVNQIADLGAAKHVFTHQIWQMIGYDCLIDGNFNPDGYQWISKDAVSSLAIAAAIRFYVKLL